MLFSSTSPSWTKCCKKDTFTFVEELTRVSLVDKFLVSIDVAGLFTNIPLRETIKLAVDLIKKSQPDLNIFWKKFDKFV